MKLKTGGSSLTLNIGTQESVTFSYNDTTLSMSFTGEM